MDSIALPAVNDTPQAELNTPNPDAPQAQGPEGQPTAEEQAQQQAEQERWFLEVETGTKYRTAEAAAQGIMEKDRFIEKLLAERNQAPQAPPAQPVDSEAAFQAEIAQLAKSQEQKLLQNPRWREAGAEAIREQAEINAYSIYEARELMRQETRASETERTQLAFIEQNRAILDSPEGQAVYQKYQRGELKLNSPQDHLQATLAEIGIKALMGQGVQPLQQPAYNGVNGAAAQLHNQGRIFQGSGQGTNPPPQPQIPAHLQQEAEWARTKGFSEEQIQAVIKSKLGTGANQ